MLKDIIDGWKNNILRNNPEIEKVALERISICNNCDKRSNYPKELNLVSTCNSCGCNIEAKVRCLQCTCPENKWKSFDSNK